MALSLRKSRGMRQFLRGLLGLGIGMSVLAMFGAAAIQSFGTSPTQSRSIPLVVLSVVYFVTSGALVWLLDWEEAPDWAYWSALLLGAPPWIALFVFRDLI